METHEQLHGKKIITLPESFPEKWYMKVTEENKEVVNEWRKSVATGYVGIELDGRNDFLLSETEDGSYFTNNDLILCDYSEITTAQFLEHVYKPWKNKPIELTKQENKMRTITWEQGQSIIDIACVGVGWKEKLFNIWARPIVMKEPIEIKEEFYQQMRKACTKEQHELFDKIFGKEKEEIDLLKETGIGERKLFLSCGCCHDCLISVYDKSTFWLSSDFLFSIDGDKLKVSHK